MATKKKKLTVNVLFDTNAIYTSSANDLFRKEIVDLFQSHSSLSDIDIVWHIPEIVLKERTFQMNKKGNEFLPSIQKLEKLLGHNLGINEAIVRSRIDEAIKNQLEKYNVKTSKIDTSKVDWDSLIHNSAFRQPPFEDNEKEKGFRDALILECLKQIIDTSPKTKSICRILFVSNDGLLNKAAQSLESAANNLNVFSKTEELVSLINVLTSQITEDVINSISENASKLFFIKNDESTLFYTSEVRKKITSDFSKELSFKPTGVDIKENGTWWIGKPGFEKKINQKVFWKSVIEVEFECFKTKVKSNFYSNVVLQNETAPTDFTFFFPKEATTKPFQANVFSNEINTEFSPYSARPMMFNSEKEKTGTGKTRFEVLWSVTLTTAQKMKSPKVETINYIDAIYE